MRLVQMANVGDESYIGDNDDVGYQSYLGYITLIILISNLIKN